MGCASQCREPGPLQHLLGTVRPRASAGQSTSLCLTLQPSPGCLGSGARGKGQVEETQKGGRPSYAIIRSTLVFGEGDLLLNNMAWALRRFPGFPVFGDGDYLVQPIYAEDLAALAVAVGYRRENLNVDHAGPDTFTFEELLRLLALAVGARVRLVHTPASLGYAVIRLVGMVLRDVVLSPDEVDGLMAGLLTSGSAPTSTAQLDEWLRGISNELGQHYVSELKGNYLR